MTRVILVNQMLDTGEEKWSRYSCGICVLKMLMVFRKPELKDIPITTLLNHSFEMDGYLENVGWKHQVLVDLASSYGVLMGFQKEFFDTPKKKKIGIKVINEKLKSGGPIAVSILKDFNVSRSAHLVIVDGFKKIGPFVTGYRIVDSHPGKRGNRYVVSKKEFLAGWRGGMIWLR